MSEENNNQQANTQKPGTGSVPSGGLDALRSKVVSLGTQGAIDPNAQAEEVVIPSAPEPQEELPKEAVAPLQGDVEEDGIIFHDTKVEEKKATTVTDEDQAVTKETAETELGKETLGGGDDIFEKKKAPTKKLKHKKEGVVQSLRTYKDDLARAINKTDTSYVSILAKEQKKRAEQREIKKEKTTQRNIYTIGIGISILLIILGVIVLLVALGRDDPNVVALPDEIPSHIFVERQTEVDVTDISRNIFIGRLNSRKDNVDGTLGSIEQLYPSNTFQTELGEQKELVTAREFFERVEARAPDAFFRAMGEQLTLGVHVFDGNEMLLIADVTNFENALAGMLEWEGEMNDDLAPLFGPAIRFERSTTTPFGRAPFGDRVIRNKETRILRDAQGNIVLLYSFVDRGTLVITTEEQTFVEVLSRLGATRI